MYFFLELLLLRIILTLPFIVNFLMLCRFFGMWPSTCLNIICLKCNSLLLSCIDNLVQNQLSIGTRVSFWTLNSILCICKFILVPRRQCLNAWRWSLLCNSFPQLMSCSGQHSPQTLCLGPKGVGSFKGAAVEGIRTWLYPLLVLCFTFFPAFLLSLLIIPSLRSFPLRQGQWLITWDLKEGNGEAHCL